MRSKLSVQLVIFLLFGLFTTHCAATNNSGATGKITPQRPRYELTLNLQEFSVLNSAARLGVGKYGGTADFSVHLAKNGNDVVWTVTITNPKLIEIWQYWMSEKTAELVNLLDFNNLDTASKTALATVKAINAKIAQARANPVWDTVKLSGLVVENERKWFIQSEDGKYLVTGSKLSNIKPMKDKHVIATGFAKVRNQFELNSFIEKKQNTLELFVMSYCPFSQKAECSIISYLDEYDGDTKPILKVHYIFYKKTGKEKEKYVCLHGKKEYNENLVQMGIRDLLPDIFHSYLTERDSNTKPWKEIAPLIGMTEEEIKLVAQCIEELGDSLVENEYAYVAGVHQITDGSPAYIWESERIRDITSIPEFQSLEFAGETCKEW